jgi:hypothetical protein
MMRRARGARDRVSEYGITPVSTPIHVNRARSAGLISVRLEDGGEILDAAVARLRGRRPPDRALHGRAPPGRRARIVGALPASSMCSTAEQRAFGLDHAYSGELAAPARPTRGSHIITGSTTIWRRTARLVEIHRKPGCDPVEFPRSRSAAQAAVGWRPAPRARLPHLMDGSA